MQIKNGRMDKGGHYDVEMKGWMEKGGNYDVQIKRVDKDIIMCKLRGG